MTQPPFQTIAVGICPQGLSAGQRAPNTSLCKAINGGTGTWQVTTDDPTIAPGDCVLLLSAGGGSNLPGGVSFGQSSQTGNLFLFEVYRNDTNAAIDVECHFAIVKFPNP